MKLHADSAEGVNIIHTRTPTSIAVNGQTFTQSVLIPSTGAITPWAAASLADLTESHFAQIAQSRPEVVVFGSGAVLRFVSPALLRPLIEARIGIETMDTAAACRTYNILVGEGRRAMAALLLGA